MTSPAAAAFVLDIVAGRIDTPLPTGACAREAAIDLLETHHLTGMWLGEFRAKHGEDPVVDGMETRLRELRRAYLKTALRSQLNLEALARARSALRTAGIDALTFKGAALIGAGIYPGPECRALSDTDILLNPTQVEAAIAALERVGFRGWVDWEPARLEWLPAFTLLDTTAPESLSISLDLHWRTAYGRYRSSPEDPGDELWDAWDPETGFPTPEAHFVLLAEHFLKHFRVTPHLVGLADLVRLTPHLRAPGRLARAAANRGSTTQLRTMLAYLGEELAVAVPSGVMHAAGSPTLTPVQRRLLGPAEMMRSEGPRTAGRMKGLLVQATLTSGPFRMIGSAWNVLMPSGDWLRGRYPEISSATDRRLEHWRRVGGWLGGRQVSPLSPNQEFEG